MLRFTSCLLSAPKCSSYDAIICGGGHNGLVAACYLAKAGKSVLVLERRHFFGGAAATEELYPGFHYSRFSYLQSLFRPIIVSDLNLANYGYELIPRNPSSATPHGDRCLLFGSDAAANFDSVAQFSRRDAERLPQYEQTLSEYAAIIESSLDSAPVDIRPADGMWNALSKARTAPSFFKSLATMQHPASDFLHLLAAPAQKILDQWFESEPLKGTLATDAVIGAMMSPETAGSGYVLLHHVMGTSGGGSRGAWAYVKGGMGALSGALRAAAADLGVELIDNASVRTIRSTNGAVTSVVYTPRDYRDCIAAKVTGLEGHEAPLGPTEDELEVSLRPGGAVFSTIHAQTTISKLLDKEGHRGLPEDYSRAIATIDSTSPVVKINLALATAPSFAPCGHPEGMLRGTIHINSTCKELVEAYKDAFAGRPSRRPTIEMTIPSALDASVAPPGQHVCQLFVQYAPLVPCDEWLREHCGADVQLNGWDTPGAREAFCEVVLRSVDEVSPGFSDSVLHRDILTPLDLQRTLGLVGGSIFHAAMGFDQLYFSRPVPGWSCYDTPISGLWMCGASTHPGGGVMGAAGRNAALRWLSQ